MSFYLASISCNTNTSDKKSIDIVGRAKMKVVPNMVELSLKAYNVRPAMTDAVAQTQTDMIRFCLYVKDIWLMNRISR
jgi:uncharacterized protein YggE